MHTSNENPQNKNKNSSFSHSYRPCHTNTASMRTTTVNDGNVKHHASHKNIINAMNENITKLNKKLANDENENKLKLFQINAESIHNINRFNNLLSYLQAISIPFDVIAITETWLKVTDVEPFNPYNIPGYNFVAQCRNGRGGGIAFFIRNSLNFDLLEKASLGSLNPIDKIKVKLQFGKAIIYIICYYRPPYSSNLTAFKEDLENEMLQSQKNNVVIIGDFNINGFNDTDYMDLIDSYAFKLTNTNPTRPSSQRILDHVITNMVNTNTFMNHTLMYSNSDHSAIITLITTSSNQTEPKRVKRSRVNYQKLSQCFTRIYNEESSSSTEVFSTNVNAYFEKIVSVTKQTVNECTKTEEFFIRKKTKLSPWFTSKMLAIMNRKDRMKTKINKKRRKVLNNGATPEALKKLTELREDYEKISKELQKECNANKTKYFKEKFANASPKAKWNAINEIMGNKRHKDSIKIMECPITGSQTEDPKTIATLLNDYFINIAKSLSEKISTNTADNENVIKSITRKPTSIFLRPTTPLEIQQIINRLKCGKSPGLDNITAEVIKSIKTVLSFPLSEAINLSLEKETFPDIFKVAVVKPLFKRSDKNPPKHDVANYRPIALLSIFNKIIESILYSRIYGFVSDQLNNHQFGFREKSGTENALIELINEIKQTLDGGNVSTSLFLDLSKAFDTIDHAILFAKMSKIGIRGKCLNILKSYFQNRMQAVLVEDQQSDFKTCQNGIGVAQGSLLGPLLYLIYINDISLLPTVGQTRCYADDTTVSYNTESEEIAKLNITNDLGLLNEYMRMNKLTLNIGKSNFIFFHSRRHKQNQSKPMKAFDDLKLKGQDSFKYLGLYMDKHLNFQKHIEHIRRKIRSMIGILYKIRCYTPKNILMMIYNAHIQSHLSYLALIYTNASDSLLKPLQVLQNRALKIIYRLPPTFHTDELYQQVAKNVLPVKGLGVFQVCTFVHKHLKGELHSNVKFERHSTHHRTRRNATSNLKSSKARTSHGATSVMCQGPRLYNMIPEDIRQTDSTQLFKSKLKTHLISSRINDLLCTRPRNLN